MIVRNREYNYNNAIINSLIIEWTYQFVIPASEARRESFMEKDSGQAGMTALYVVNIYKNH